MSTTDQQIKQSWETLGVWWTLQTHPGGVLVSSPSFVFAFIRRHFPNQLIWSQGLFFFSIWRVVWLNTNEKQSLDGVKSFGGSLATGPALCDLPSKPQRSCVKSLVRMEAACSKANSRQRRRKRARSNWEHVRTLPEPRERVKKRCDMMIPGVNSEKTKHEQTAFVNREGMQFSQKRNLYILG